MGNTKLLERGAMPDAARGQRAVFPNTPERRAGGDSGSPSVSELTRQAEGAWYCAEAAAVRLRFRIEYDGIMSRLPDLDERGMSAEVRSIATRAGMPLEELHPFDHGLTRRGAR